MFDWTSLLTGIQFLLGLQLLIIACIHLLDRPKEGSIPLGFLCLIHGLWFFKSVFSDYWKDDLCLFLLIGPGKPIFAVSLLLFYYKIYSSKLTRNYVVIHLAAPTLYYLLLLFFRFFMAGNSPALDQNLSLFFTAGVFIIFWVYFFITKQELKSNTQKKLIPKAYKKVMFLFYSLYFFLLQIPIWDMLRHVVRLEMLPSGIQDIIARLYDTIFIYIGEYMTYTYLHVLGYFLFLYAMSEVSFFKQLFLPKNASINENVIRDKARLDGLVERFFGKNKLFKDPELSLSSCASTFNITKKELIDYLKLSNRGVFKDFVNKWRVDEFKRMAKEEEFRHYDLVGLAKECGFKSKSTFFRVFKELEGMTPNQYKNTEG